MPPTPSPSTPRIILYYQTHHTPSNTPISLLPLLTTPKTHLTHLILAALHLNPVPDSPTPHLTLNDHAPSHPRNQTLWAELSLLRAAGIRILALLGGAAKGTYALLDTLVPGAFEAAYRPLHDFIAARGLDGLDLDVEEEMSLAGIIQLIDQLKADFGEKFIVTLAPVAAALLDPRANLSGFDYAVLERERGASIGWYNAQFYCGWGDMHSGAMYDAIVWRGWRPEKVVVGVVTSPENGSGWVPLVVLGWVLGGLRERYPPATGDGGGGFGGVMGWEYFNALPGGRERPWEWVTAMTRVLRGGSGEGLTAGERAEAEALVARWEEEIREARRKAAAVEENEARRKSYEDNEKRKKLVIFLADGDKSAGEEAAIPTAFEYFSDEEGNDREDASIPRSFEYFTDGSLEE